MEIIQKELVFKKDLDYYSTHLDIINPFIPNKLTSKERAVLAMFMSFKGELAEKDRFGTSLRKIVRKEMKLSPGGLGNYIRAFKEKEVINEELDGSFTIVKYLFPNDNKQFYQFKLLKKNE